MLKKQKQDVRVVYTILFTAYLQKIFCEKHTNFAL